MMKIAIRRTRHFITAIALVSAALVSGALVSGALVSGSNVSSAEGMTWEAYLDRVADRALGEGIRRETIEDAFKGLEPEPRVIVFDRRQPEFTQTFDEYLSARVSEFRIRKGRELMARHAKLLASVEEAYGVERQYIVAIWGLETGFGSYQGKYPIVRSLATLGHDPRRSEFFTDQLVMALRILDEGHIEPEQFVGAWAGAMGQSQFMPGSFLEFAADFDGDGKKDIWSSEADVFASIANYLKANGWVQGAGWGSRVETPESMTFKAESNPDPACRALKHHTVKRLLVDWQDNGLKVASSLPAGEYAIVIPEDGEQSVYLVGGNFRSILRYNCANKYAVSVGLLADALAIQPPS